MNWDRIKKVVTGTACAAIFGFFVLALNPLYWEFLALTDAKFGSHLCYFKTGALLAMSITGSWGFIALIIMTRQD